MKKRLYITLSLNSLLCVFSIIVLLLTILLGFDFFQSFVTASVDKALEPVIVIDAGHGGEDGGTVSSKGYIEKDINLSISKKLDDIFTLLGYDTLMIRTEDKMIFDEGSQSIRQKKSSDLHNRTDIVNKTYGSILLSIHQNHFTESRYNGAQVFYSKNNGESKHLAQNIQDSIVSQLQPQNKRQIKMSGSEIYLLDNAKAPSVMVECGFLSNENEAELLINENYQIKMSLCIVKGTLDFINLGK